MEALLKVRHLNETHALGELSKVLVKYNAFQNKKLEIKNEMELQYKNYEANQGTILDIQREVIWDRYFKNLRNQIIAIDMDIEKLNVELNQVQEMASIAQREKKVLELLRERELAIFKYELQRSERKELADLNQRKIKRELFANFKAPRYKLGTTKNVVSQP